MKKTMLLMLLLPFLCSCSEKNDDLEQGLKLRTELLNASSFSFDADITADYVNSVHQFSLQCRSDEEGNVTFTVSYPESIAGITGQIEYDGGKLIFDDTVLYFDLLPDEQLSPVIAPWILVKALRGGYIEAAGREDEGIRLTVEDSYKADAMMLDIWLNEQNYPHRAEILHKGCRILTLIIRNVSIL